MGSARLPIHRADDKRDMDRKARRREHAAAFVACTDRITRHIQDEIGRPGMRLLEEIGSRAKRGPAEVLEQIVSVSRDHKAEAEAIAPVAVLARRLGYDLAPIASAAGDGCSLATSAVLAREAGEGIAALLRFAETCSPADALRAMPEVDDVIRAAHLARGILAAAAAKEQVNR